VDYKYYKLFKQYFLKKVQENFVGKIIKLVLNVTQILEQCLEALKEQGIINKGQRTIGEV